jgi:hypothetical protein
MAKKSGTQNPKKLLKTIQGKVKRNRKKMQKSGAK